jgi:hypothetical protein
MSNNFLLYSLFCTWNRNSWYRMKLPIANGSVRLHSETKGYNNWKRSTNTALKLFRNSFKTSLT